MSGLLSALGIAESGLNVSQDQINVTSHNVSNASTDGYSRQRLDVETASPQNNLQGAGQIGSGVKSSEIERIRDVFVDYQIRDEDSTYGNYKARSNTLDEVQNVFNEPSSGTGLSTLIDNFLIRGRSFQSSLSLQMQELLLVTPQLHLQLNSTMRIVR